MSIPCTELYVPNCIFLSMWSGFQMTGTAGPGRDAGPVTRIMIMIVSRRLLNYLKKKIELLVGFCNASGSESDASAAVAPARACLRPSGFLPGTTSYVYVRCRTYTLRHRTVDVRCRVQHRTYDIVRTILHTILHVRHRTIWNPDNLTYTVI